MTVIEEVPIVLIDQPDFPHGKKQEYSNISIFCTGPIKLIFRLSYYIFESQMHTLNY